MSALLVVTALAAQAATVPAGSSTAPTSTDATSPKIAAGETDYLDLEAGAGYSSNPNLLIGGDQGSAFGRISLHAVHSRVSARSTTLLSAYAEDDSYTNHHGSQQSANLYGRYDTAISEHARLFVDANATYQEGGQLDTRILGLPIIPPPIPGGIITPPILIPPTGDFLSVTGREYTFGAHGGGTFALGARDSVSLSSGVEHIDFHSGLTSTNYTRIPATLAYDRQLTAHTTVGARLTAENTDYNGPASFRVITPEVTARTSLSPTISLDGAIGVSFARIENGLVTRNTTGLSAQANLCGQGETSFFCAQLSADEEAATTAGPARALSASVNYSRRLDANQAISFSLGVTHYSTPISVIIAQTFSSATYYRAAASYSRKFASRVYGGVDLSARKVTQNGPDPKTDLSGSLFLRYRFGDVQ
jgi:hypothetical protein